MANFTVDPGADDTDAVITLPDKDGIVHSIEQLQWSYSADPTTGGIEITDDGVLIWQSDITISGLGFIPFDHGIGGTREVVRRRQTGGLDGTRGKKVVVTLKSGGAGVRGKLNIQTRPL